MECELCIDLANTEGGRCHTCMEKRITELRQKLLQEGQALHEKNMRVLELEQEVADLKEKIGIARLYAQQIEQEWVLSKKAKTVFSKSDRALGLYNKSQREVERLREVLGNIPRIIREEYEHALREGLGHDHAIQIAVDVAMEQALKGEE
jgi:hypothetical protein